MGLIIRRIERIREVEHGIQDEGIEQICANILYDRVCVCERGNDATYFAQRHQIGGQKLEMKYTESLSDRVPQEWTSKRSKCAMP